MYLLADKGKI